MNFDADVIIIGAGWSGLAAAVELTQNNKSVIVVESSPSPGGRARSVKWNKLEVDNGQHLLIGGYASVRKLIQEIGVKEHDIFHREPFYLEILRNRNKMVFPSSNLLFPMNFLYGMIKAKGITLSEKYSVSKLLFKIIFLKYHLKSDCSILDFLRSQSQPEDIIKDFWGPIAVATLTTPISTGSAQLFINVLRDSFQSKQSSEIMIPKVSLGSVIPKPTIEYLRKNGQQVYLSSRAEGVNFEERSVTIKNKTLYAKNIVIATQIQQISRLIPTSKQNLETIRNINKIKLQPIITCYFKTNILQGLNKPKMLGTANGSLGQWYFNHNGLLSIVISAIGDHEKMPKDQLIAALWEEACRNFEVPHAAIPETKLIKEKFATFSAEVNINKLRPNSSRICSNIFITGDYLKNQYPATLEGAVINGFNTAKEILAAD